ncbi:hypothetical protein ANABIO32_17690 [Rossellomorea marisflavi]|nr:hypothetical protein ANABIO32_17690 [Rossellomorea marisflavi]
MRYSSIDVIPFSPVFPVIEEWTHIYIVKGFIAEHLCETGSQLLKDILLHSSYTCLDSSSNTNNYSERG